MGALALFLNLYHLVHRAMHVRLYRCAPESQKGETIVVAVGRAEIAPMPIALNLLLGC